MIFLHVKLVDILKGKERCGRAVLAGLLRPLAGRKWAKKWKLDEPINLSPYEIRL